MGFLSEKMSSPARGGSWVSGCRFLRQERRWLLHLSVVTIVTQSRENFKVLSLSCSLRPCAVRTRHSFSDSSRDFALDSTWNWQRRAASAVIDPLPAAAGATAAAGKGLSTAGWLRRHFQKSFPRIFAGHRVSSRGFASVFDRGGFQHDRKRSKDFRWLCPQVRYFGGMAPAELGLPRPHRGARVKVC